MFTEHTMMIESRPALRHSLSVNEKHADDVIFCRAASPQFWFPSRRWLDWSVRPRCEAPYLCMGRRLHFPVICSVIHALLCRI